jgi:amphi-Trp domain-containing protein
MPEETLFRFEQSMTRPEVAAYLRTVADALEADGALTLSAGEQSVAPEVPERVTFEVKVEREPDAQGDAEMSVEFELEWDEGAGGSGALRIE